jgi:hypothetical protein
MIGMPSQGGEQTDDEEEKGKFDMSVRNRSVNV